MIKMCARLFLYTTMVVGSTLLLTACSPREEPGTPPGMDGNILYGQADMEYVLENIAVFRTRTDLIHPDPSTVAYLRNLKRRITLKVFMGSWCVDAQTHVPELFKALLEADNNRISVLVIGLDRRKRDRDGLAEKYGIELTPTIVVEYKGMEIGRIIEVPSKDAASDVVSILQGTLGR